MYVEHVDEVMLIATNCTVSQDPPWVVVIVQKERERETGVVCRDCEEAYA